MAYPSHRLVLPTFTVQPSFWEKMGMWPLTQKGWTPLLLGMYRGFWGNCIIHFWVVVRRLSLKVRTHKASSPGDMSQWHASETNPTLIAKGKLCRGDKIFPSTLVWIQIDLNSCNKSQAQKCVPATCPLVCEQFMLQVSSKFSEANLWASFNS